MAWLSDTAIEEIAVSLSGKLTSRQRAALIRELARQYGVSEATIYSRFPAGRRARRDAGVEHAEIEDERFSLALAMKVQTDGTLGWNRIAQLSEAGVSMATLRRRADAKGVTLRRIRKGSRSYRRWEAPHSNALCQIDDTVSVLYYVHEDGTLRRYDIRPYKNKPQTELPQLHLFVATDDHSRLKYARYYIRKRDTVPMQFLFDTFRRKEGLLWGVPDAVLVDQDGIWKSNRVVRALDEAHLNVKIERTMPKSPQSHGKIEKSIGDLERGFETLIQWMDHVENVEQLNQELDRYVRMINWERHSSIGDRPMKRWERDLPKDRPVRLLPDEDIQRWLMREEITRKVDAYLQLRLKDNRRGVWMHYSLGQIPAARDWVGEEVTISYWPGDYSTIRVCCNGSAEVEVSGQEQPIVNEKGEFEGGWQSDTQKLIAELAAREIKLRPNWEKYMPAEASLPRIAPAAEQIESVMWTRPPTVLERVAGKYKANEIMRELAGRDLTYEEKGEYNTRFLGETVTVEELRAWVDEITRRQADDQAEAIAG